MINSRRAKHSFSPECKLEAVEQIVQYQRDAKEVALVLEREPEHSHKWIRLYTPLSAMPLHPNNGDFSLSKYKLGGLKWKKKD